MEFSAEDFKKDYHQHGAGDLEAQLPHLQSLAEKYIKKAAETGDWVDYVKAHGLLNSCIIRCTSAEDQSALRTKVFELERRWYAWEHTLRTPEEFHEITASLKNDLIKIRSRCRNCFLAAGGMMDRFKVTDLFSDGNKEEMASFSNQVNIDSQFCTQMMIELAKKICEKSEGIVGNPHSPYVVIALGSMARNEATPYSDLEYAFIIGPNGDKSYFHRLAVDTYFRISNLGDTPLKYLYIEELHDNYRAKGEKRWFEDRAKSGFKIDGLMPKAGNIPTGNGLPDGQSLILTVEELVGKYGHCLEENMAGNSPDVVGDLSDLLASVVPVHWSKDGCDLLSKFRERRSAKQDEIGETADGHRRLEEKRIATLHADLKKYSFCANPGELRLDTRSVQVKSDIFCYPTILAHDLKMLLNLDQCETAWNIYEELRKKNHISVDILRQFQFILMSAIWIRTSAYLVGDAQREYLAFHPKFDMTDRDDRFFVPKKLYVMMASRLIPIKQAILDYRSELGYAQSVISALSQLKVTSIPFQLQSRIHYSCTDFKGALDVIHSNLGDTCTSSLASLLKATVPHNLSRVDFVDLTLNTLFQNGYYKVAIELCDYLCETESDSQESPYLSRSLYQGIKGQCLMMQGSYVAQATMFDEAQEALLKHFDSDKTTIFLKLTDMLANEPGNEKGLEAVKRLKIALDRFVVNFTFVTDSIRYHQGCYEEHRKSFDRLNLIYSLVDSLIFKDNTDNLHSADFKTSIGLCHLLQFGNYNNAEEYLMSADRIYKDIYGKSAATVEISTIKLFLGYIEFKRGKFTAAREMCRDSLDILGTSEQGLSSHFITNHQVQAEILSQMGNYEQAQVHIRKCYEVSEGRPTPIFNKAITMMTEANLTFRKAKNSNVSIGDMLSAYEYARELLLQAIGILQRTVKEKYAQTHPDIARAYTILGEICLATDDKQAIAYFTIAQEMFVEAYDGNNRPHIDLADVMFLIGEVRLREGDNSQARLHFQQAIHMMQIIFGNEEPQHPTIQTYTSWLQSCGTAPTSLQEDELD